MNYACIVYNAPRFLGRAAQRTIICSACGADHVCDCNAPALEREAARREMDRQHQAKLRKKKREQKQASRHVTGERFTVEDDLEADAYRAAFLLRAADAMAFAVYSGIIDAEIVAAAKKARMLSDHQAAI